MEKLSQYQKNKLKQAEAGIVTTKHKFIPGKHAKTNANDPGDPFVKKLRILYAQQLESGVEGVTSKCHYQGLTGLAMSYHKPHEDVKRLMDMHYDSLPRPDKDAIAAFGYMVLMGHV